MKVLADGKKVDILFSDIAMHGGMDGHELVNKALKQHPGLKVLLTSGFTARRADVPACAGVTVALVSVPVLSDEIREAGYRFL